MAKPVFSKGKVAAASPAAGKFLKFADGDKIAFAPLVGLDEMISCDQHEFWDTNPAVIFPCLQTEDCPGCKRGDKPKFKAFLPVVTKEGESKVFAFTIKTFRQLEDIEAELGTLKGNVISVRRTGTGMKTSYTPVAIGKKMNVDKIEPIDIEALLGPTTAKEIEALIANRGVSLDASEEPEEAEEPKAKKTSKKADDDWDEV